MHKIAIIALVVFVAIWAGLLWFQGMRNRLLGERLLAQPDNAARWRHRVSSTNLLITEGILVLLVLILETLVRSDSNFIAPFTSLLIVHVAFAITYMGTTIAMKFWVTGKRHRTLHVLLGKYLVPCSFYGMLGTGGLLLAQILYTVLYP